MVIEAARFKEEMKSELGVNESIDSCEDDRESDRILLKDAMNKDALCKIDCKNRDDFQEILEQTDEVRTLQ